MTTSEEEHEDDGWSRMVYEEMKEKKGSGCGEVVRVVYVDNAAAKQIKNRLEADAMLHRDFRMTHGNDCVAIPIVNDATYEGGLSIEKGVQGFGLHFCPYSSAILGNGNRLRRCNETSGDERLTRTQIGLLRAISNFLDDNETSKGVNSEMPQLIVALKNSDICPTRLEVFGDDRTVVIPLRAFNLQETSFRSFVSSALPGSSHANFLSKFLWKHLAETYNSTRVVRRGEVDPNSPDRKSGFRILWTSPSSYSALTGPGSSTWITVTEQGIRQSFDLTRVMFSRGNISEKIRFGKLVQAHDEVLDMYAGIGYFALPALVHGKARRVHCCEWNQDAVESLLYNLEGNGVHGRASVTMGDCRVIFEHDERLHGKFDRVSLGLLPSSEGGWRTAVRALRTNQGGWLHVHGNVPVHELHHWVRWLCLRLRVFARQHQSGGEDWVVLATHVEKVKSFAPNVNHYVADIFVGLLSLFTLGNDFPGKASSCLPGSACILKDDGNIELCGDDVPPPSCALSDEGVLHQTWMRSA